MLKINSFIYNVHYVQHVQIYRICEQHTYNLVALKNITDHLIQKSSEISLVSAF